MSIFLVIPGAFLLGAFGILTLFSRNFYPQADLWIAFAPSDLVSLILVVPLVLAAMVILPRNPGLGRVLSLGAWGYLAYGSLITVICLPSPGAFGIHLGILALLTLGLWGLRRTPAPDQAPKKTYPRKTFSSILLGLGLLFLARLGSQLVGHFTGVKILGLFEGALGAADLGACGLWILGALHTIRKPHRALETLGALYLMAALLFLGLLGVLALRSLWTQGPFPLEDFLVIAGLTPLTLIPCLWILRRL